VPPIGKPGKVRNFKIRWEKVGVNQKVGGERPGKFGKMLLTVVCCCV